MDRLLKPITILAPARYWPAEAMEPAARDRLFFTNLRLSWTPAGLSAAFGLAATGPAAVRLPGPGGLRLEMAPAEGRPTAYADCLCTWSDDTVDVTLEHASLHLEIPLNVLQPVDRPDRPLRLPLPGAVTFTMAGGLDAYPSPADRPALPPCRVGRTGLVLSADALTVDLSRVHSPPEVAAAGLGPEFVGLFAAEARVTPPPWLEPHLPWNLALRNCAIDHDGVTGQAEAEFVPGLDRTALFYQGSGAGKLFGLPIGLQRFALGLRRGSIVDCDIHGRMLLPGVHREVPFRIGLGSDGTAQISLADAPLTWHGAPS